MDNCRKSCTTMDTCNKYGCANAPREHKSGSAIPLRSSNESAKLEQVVYMLSDGEGSSFGPFHGVPGLNIAALADQYRALKYSQADQEQAEYCWLSHDEFIAWLLDTKVLSPVEHVSALYNLSDNGEHRFVPSHWPTCPECGKGKGDEVPGRVRYGLNRWEWYRKCLECGHQWGHHEVPHDSNKPMLEDDGRETVDGCVPYSLSQATGIPMPQMLPICERLGWAEGYGMDVDKAMIAAREVGFQLRVVPMGVAGRPQLGRTLRQLSPDKKYIIQTNRHWLAVINGENRDTSETSMRAQVYQCWEVVPV